MKSMSSLVMVTAMLVVLDLVVCLRTLVASATNGDMDLDFYVTIRKKRSENWDFTQINRYVCPPSLCRMYDESTKDYKPRPKGTGGTIFYQGDIILDDKMTKVVYKEKDNEGKSRKKRATMKPRRRLWKNGVVKYKFGKDITSRARKAFLDGMKHIESMTCVRFEEKAKGDEDFIRFISEPGCWSQVGKVGGVQLVSLGSGCESLGTAVHEIVHALGVWHEQARPDRNRYVKILERNISPKFMPDFEVVDRTVSSSRGYTYDYNSLMHYSKYAFTRNGKPTIDVIGKGRALGLRIGQRKGLSPIDMSQLRDMYKCNFKTDIKESYCGKGWKKRDLSCYQFFPKEKAQFGPASTACRELKSHLVVVNDKREQRFLDKYLIKKFPDVLTWRTAGRLVNEKMVWYEGPGKIKDMAYKNWAKNNPRSYTSTVLKRTARKTYFKWYGDWIGSFSQKPNYEHAYICEKAAKRKCLPLNHVDGRDYRGEMDYTRAGYTCQKWTDNYPRNHSLIQAAKDAAESKDKTDKDGLGEHNFCRNPSALRRNRPWCYTTKKKSSWGFCDISACQKSVERYKQRQASGSARSLKRRRNMARRQTFSSSTSPQKLTSRREEATKENRSSSSRSLSSKRIRKEKSKRRQKIRNHPKRHRNTKKNRS